MHVRIEGSMINSSEMARSSCGEISVDELHQNLKQIKK
jgi:hypothetical protein